MGPVSKPTQVIPAVLEARAELVQDFSSATSQLLQLPTEPLPWLRDYKHSKNTCVSVVLSREGQQL